MGARELTLLVGLWISASWIGADMYMPAMPFMDETFNTTEAMVNATLFAYTFVLPFGALIGGPLSDKFGRRGPTAAGALAAMVFSLACVFVPSVELFILFRCLSGLGAGFITATTMALLKDCLQGDELDNSITITQSLALLGPVAAPFLGSLLLQAFTWQAIFVCLAIAQGVCLLWFMTAAETLPPEAREAVSTLGSLGLVFKVARNVPFTLLLVALCLAPLSFGIFMTLGAYIFVDWFQLSATTYSLLYGLIALSEGLAPFLYLALRRRLGDRRVAYICAGMMAASGLVLVTVAGGNLWVFFAFCLPFTVAEGMARPCAYQILLGGAEEDAGSTSALVGFGVGLMTSLGTPIASLPVWGGNHLVALGAPMIVSAVLMVALIAVVRRMGCKLIQ